MSLCDGCKIPMPWRCDEGPVETETDCLRVLMGEISETCYAAGWMVSLPEDLWRLVESGEDTGTYGMGEVPVKHLRELAERVGGWFTGHEEDNSGFVPLAEWRLRFWKHEAERLKQCSDQQERMLECLKPLTLTFEPAGLSIRWDAQRDTWWGKGAWVVTDAAGTELDGSWSLTSVFAQDGTLGQAIRAQRETAAATATSEPAAEPSSPGP